MNPSDPSRRRFLLGAGGSAVAAAGGALAWSQLVTDRVGRRAAPAPATTTSSAPAPTGAGSRLVVVQLGGGNDALNSLPPADGRYVDRRPTLAVAEADRVPLAGTTTHALHPSLAPLAPWWAAGSLAAVVPVAIEGQSRSHFQALDTWWSARPGEHASTGWLGRWLDATADTDPDNPLRAVALGGGSPALVGTRSTVTVVNDPERFRLLTPPGADAEAITAALLASAAPLGDEPLLAAARAALPVTFEAADQVGQAVGATDVDPASGPLGSLLRTAAGLIDLDLGTRVVHVSAGGFDTHAGQADSHPRLLADLADGLTALLAAVEDQGRADEVVVLVLSEFGRRVAENGSGTDHGFGGLALLAGTPVAGGRVVGQVDLGSLDGGDLAPDVDARSLYAACLDHLGGVGGPDDAQLTDEVLDGPYDRLDLLV